MAAREDEHSELEAALREIFPGNRIELWPSQARGHALVAQADVAIGADHLHLWVEILKNASNARLLDAAELLHMSRDGAQGSIPVIAMPYLSPSRQKLLREARAAFIDYAGNAWLMAPGIHVDRRGFSNPERELREGRDLFSDKASLVLRVLLGAPAPMGVRQIAEMASSRDEHIRLTPGHVSKVVKELERRGYASKREERIVLRHDDELLSDWLVSYRKRKQPVSRSYFISAPSAESLMPGLANSFDANRVDYVFTGHAGASLVDRYADFDVVDVYVRSLEEADKALMDMGARRVERGGNVNVSLPYYRVSAFYDAQMPKGPIKVASDIQLYLDLYDFPIRGREQAEHLYERRLRPMIERDDQL